MYFSIPAGSSLASQSCSVIAPGLPSSVRSFVSLLALALRLAVALAAQQPAAQVDQHARRASALGALHVGAHEQVLAVDGAGVDGRLVAQRGGLGATTGL